MSHRSEIDAIVKQVESWPSEDRQALALQLLTRTGAASPKSPRPSLSRLAGVGNPSGAAFTDSDVDDIRLQALNEKHRL